MIGTDLNLDLPSLADTYSVALAKVATALEAIEDSIADQATPAALNVTTNLSIGGNHLTSVGGIVLAAGNSPSSAGSFYYSGGNFYLKDATGVIQLTSAGSINLSAIGAIGGDYGSGDESFNYDLASQEYRARASSTAWADLVADDLVLMEPGASPSYGVRITSQDMAANYTLTLPAAVPAATRVLQMANDGTVSTLDSASESITAFDYKHVNNRTIRISWLLARDVAGAHTYNNDGRWTLGNSTGALQVPFEIEHGARITGFHVYVNKASDNTNTLTARLFYVTASGGAVEIANDTESGNAPGNVILTNTSFTHDVTTSGRSYFIQLTQSDTSPSANDTVGTAEVLYTRP